jgi:hypothetical protein
MESLPLLTFSFLEYFHKKDFSNKVLVEIGSGNSTLFWEKIFGKVISYENDFLFFNEIVSKIKKTTTEVNLFSRNIFENNDFLKNIGIADYIIIDNDPMFISRLKFSIFAEKNKKEECAIILDNSTWNLDAYQYLSTHFFVKDFPGINKYNQITVTSLFEERKEKKYFSSSLIACYE